MFLLMQLSSQEVLALSGILGAIFGYFIRGKAKNGAIASVIVGFISAIILTYLLNRFFLASYLLVPIYALAGSWLGNYLYKKLF